MMHNTKGILKTLPAIVGLLFVCSGTASAGLVQVDFSGSVSTADMGNSLGLTAGDTVTGLTTFEDSLLTGTGFEFIGLGTEASGFGGTLTMNMGAVTYVESDDNFYFGDFFPELLFTDGALTGFDFIVDNKPGVGDEFDTLETDFGFFSLSDTRVKGEWDTFSDPFPVQVPEPSTLSLLGLAGLGLLARRRKVA